MTESKKKGGLGLRDIQAFNDALLAKASWRILTCPNSLIARVLVGKHCKKKSFLDVQIKDGQSHGWRGILIGRDLLKKNLGCVIGNGKSTRIWEDPCLSLHKPLQPMGPASETTRNWCVADLMEPGSNNWDMGKIREVLPDYEKMILSIKASKTGAADKIMWLGNESGTYTTRSGYHAALKLEKAEENAEQEEEAEQGPDWINSIWKITTSPKIQLFLWSMMQESLTTAANLKRRKVKQDDKCVRCGQSETNLHVLFQCEYAKEVWEKAPFKENQSMRQWGSAAAALSETKKHMVLPPIGLKGDTLFVWIIWKIWCARNKLIFETRHATASETLHKEIVEAREWYAAQNSEKQEPSTKRNKETIMTALRGSLNCNSDAAWDRQRETVGIGWRITKDNGEIVEQRGETKENVKTPLVAEAMALLEGLNRVRGMGFNKLRMRSDSLVLVNAINSGEKPKEIHGLLCDIEEMASQFSFIVFKHIPRKENDVADRLAKGALLANNGRI